MNDSELIKTKKNAAMLSIISNTLLIVLKFTAGILTSSFGIISEAIHSMSDLLASFIAYFAVKKASKPADRDHEFGHEKYEDFSGLVEGILIIGAAIYIVYESAMKIITREYVEVSVDAAIYVMLFSVIVNIIVSKHIFKTAEKTGSVALFADAEHLRTDIYTSAGVAAGLVLIKITDIHIIDPLIALFVAVLIFEAGINICKKTIANLLDTSLPDSEQITISKSVKSFKDKGINDLCILKTRSAGARKKIELTVCVNPSMSVRESHDICNLIESELSCKIGNTDTIIHIEPICEKCVKNPSESTAVENQK